MSSPLIDRLISHYGYPLLDAATLDDFLACNEIGVLFFTGDPTNFPEANDVAVILPELMAVIGRNAAAGVIVRSEEMELQKRYGFLQWPTLVVCRRGSCRGFISRVRDWSDYLAEFGRLLADAPEFVPNRIELHDVSGAAGS